MMSFEQVIDIFGDYLALDTEMEVCKSRYGYIRVEFHGTGELPGYCSGMVCRTPKELFDLLLSDYESYLSTPFKNAVFRRNEMSFFAGQHAGVYSLDYRTTCRLEARQVLIYQCILDLTGENDKYNHSKAAHLYPPFSYIPRSAKNYKIEPALTLSGNPADKRTQRCDGGR